jgi:hypothetical protein
VAGAADTALDLVKDEERAGLIAAAPQRREKFGPHVKCTADALHRLDNDRRSVLAHMLGDGRDLRGAE